MGWLPIMLRLDGIRCVVVGGGAVAERKVAALLQAGPGQNGAQPLAGQAAHINKNGAAVFSSAGIHSSGGAIVTVVSPEVTGKLAAWAKGGHIRWESREFRAGDAHGAAIVFAATGVSKVNEWVAAEAKACGAWVNIADDPERSALHMPSVVRRGKLMLTVSTSGASPSAARRIRRELEGLYGPEYELWLDWLAQARLLLRTLVAETEQRQQLHLELERLDGPTLLRKGLLPAGWQQAWLVALQRDPTLEAVRRLAHNP